LLLFLLFCSFVASLLTLYFQFSLFFFSVALLNFGTQLKILAAVKAAGGDKDSDEQLITLVRNIGYGLPSLLTYAIEGRLKGFL
jgi:hypothetical protein